jgi:hypothetical protein
MDASGLFTVLGIFVAIITLISEEKRQDFFLRASLGYWLFFLALNLLALGVIYSNVITTVTKLKPINYFWGFDEKTAVLTSVIIMSFLFIYKLLGKKLPRLQYNKWSNISYRLLREKKYHILSFLLEKYIDQFLKIVNKNTTYEKFYNYVSRNSRDSIEEILSFPPVQISRIRKIKRFIFTKILSFLPTEIGCKPLLYQSIEKLLKSSGFLSYLVETHPLIPVKLTSSPSFLQIDEFTDNFFKYLISNKNSLLYREIKDNQHFMYSTGYRIQPENFILSHYFSDPNVAINANIWKPIGDYICKYIKEQNGKDNFYNSYCESFSYTEEPWECPIFVGIQFFDIMVKTTIYKKINDHMWLMYYEYFLNGILDNIDRSKNSEIWQEFPLKFDYLIYCLVSNCSEWVVAANYLYEGNSKILPIERASYCLGGLLRKILLSTNIAVRQKIYHLEILLKTMRDLDLKAQNHLSQQIFHTLVREYQDGPKDLDLTWLKNTYLMVDHVLRISGSTFDNEIKKAP